MSKQGQVTRYLDGYGRVRWRFEIDAGPDTATTGLYPGPNGFTLRIR